MIMSKTANAPILQLQNVKKCVNQETIIENATLSLMPGEVVALVGPSGSGKTTILQIAGLLESITDGSIYLSGVNCSQADETTRANIRRQSIGFIYQFHHLLKELTVIENVAIGKIIRNNSSLKTATAQSMELLDKVNMAHKANQAVQTLSGGEKQRVAIARALSNNPQIIIADEPTGNLDPENGAIISDLLIETAKTYQSCVLLATHSKEITNAVDRIICVGKDKKITQ